MLGDGVHFHFRDPDDAVRASLDVVRRVRPRGLPPAHVGVNAGPMIYEEGGLLGRAVNIAARILRRKRQCRSGLRRRGPRGTIVEPSGFVEVVGDFELKGVARSITIYEATHNRLTLPSIPARRDPLTYAADLSLGMSATPRRVARVPRAV